MVTKRLRLPVVQQTSKLTTSIRMAYILGNRLPAHATSAGKILLAHLEPEQQLEWLKKYPLKRLTKYTCINDAEFLQLLRELKEQDWCYSCEEHELSVHALAIPIYL